MSNFKELKIWARGMLIAAKCFKLTATFPKSEQYGLVSQLNRACVSIPSNIAEGCSRSSMKDFNRFILISLGSCFEAETQLMISKQLNYGDGELIDELLEHLSAEQKMLSAFSKKLSNLYN